MTIHNSRCLVLPVPLEAIGDALTHELLSGICVGMILTLVLSVGVDIVYIHVLCRQG